MIETVRLKLDKCLEEKVHHLLEEQGEKIALIAGGLSEHPERLEEESDLTRLAVILQCLDSTKAMYDRRGISEEVFYDTMSDIRIWCENNGNRGLENYEWLTSHVRAEIFRIGRLQYQLGICDDPALDYSRLPFEQGEKLINVHIPQGEKLSYESCVDSLKQGEVFLKTYFPEYSFRYFLCESWLLYDQNRDFMREGSNILRFSSLFDHAYSVRGDDDQAIERIFGRRERSVEDYPEHTSLQRAAKKYMLSGGRLGIGFGTIRRGKYVDAAAE